MKARLYWASNYKREESVEINDLQDLLVIIDREGSDVIVSRAGDSKLEIWVYDDYME